MRTHHLAASFLAVVSLAALGCAPPPPPPVAPPPPAEPPPPPAPDAQIQVPGDIEFGVGAATIHENKSSQDVLWAVTRILRSNPSYTKVRVEGHTDSDGNEAENQALSDNRAAAVVKWLLSKGIAPSRLHSVGCGSKDPLVPNTSTENKQKNRRTEFDLEELDGKPAPGMTAACAPNPARKH